MFLVKQGLLMDKHAEQYTLSSSKESIITKVTRQKTYLTAKWPWPCGTELCHIWQWPLGIYKSTTDKRFNIYISHLNNSCDHDPAWYYNVPFSGIWPKHVLYMIKRCVNKGETMFLDIVNYGFTMVVPCLAHKFFYTELLSST